MVWWESCVVRGFVGGGLCLWVGCVGERFSGLVSLVRELMFWKESLLFWYLISDETER